MGGDDTINVEMNTMPSSSGEERARAKKDAASRMRSRLRVERNIRSPGVREVLHDSIHGRDHEVHVDGRRDAVLA